MATSLSDLRAIFYDILRENEGSSAYPASLTNILLNAAQQNILSGRVVNPVTKEEVRKGQIHFLNAEAFYSNVP